MKKQNLKVLLSLLAVLLTFQFSYGQGSRYTGEYKKSNPIRYEGKKDLIIDGLEISGSNVDGIQLFNCENITIKNSKFGPTFTKRAIYLSDCKNITVIDCSFEDVLFALLAHRSESVKFEYNEVKNVTGSHYDSSLYGCMVQYDKVSGRGNSISYNVCENIPNQSAPEDLINLYMTKGTADSPVIIRGNWLRGGGPSNSGGGIILGDVGGAYQIAEDNILVDPGQYGVAIAGGNNITLRNNKVFGKSQSFTNVGLYAANWAEEFGKSFNITVENNIIHFKNRNGSDGSFWYMANVEPVIGKETNKFDKSLTASILPDKIIGRARDNVSDNNGSNEPENNGPVQRPDNNNDGSNNNNQENVGSGPSSPSENEQVNSPITIYVDTYNRICVNVRGRIYRSANVSVTNPNGRRIYTQPLTGYHTVVRSRIDKGTYTVIVKNGNQTRNQQIVIN